VPEISVGTGPVGVAGLGVTTAGVAGAVALPAATITGAPYSAQVVTEHVQILADGNRIVQTTTGSVARDSQGRVRRDEALPALTANDADAPHLVLIEDPVAGVHWNLNAQNKTAVKMPFMQMKAVEKGHSVAQGPLPTILPAPGPEKTWFFSTSTGPAGMTLSNRVEAGPDSNVSNTDLGTQIVEGVTAKGTRTTRTIPAGAMGNEQPISMTTETWFSPDLKVLIMSKNTDPRIGETTYKLTDIQRSEPAANLFQVPDDYTVKDQPANTFIYQSIKKN
jgi:hypothetical protein